MQAVMNEETTPVAEMAEVDSQLNESELTPREQVVRLIADFRNLAASEYDYYRARLAYSKSVAKWTGFHVAVALFALFGSITAFILGLLLILSSIFGPVIATLSVTTGFTIIAFLFATLARRSSRNFSFPELDDE